MGSSQAPEQAEEHLNARVDGIRAWLDSQADAPKFADD